MNSSRYTWFAVLVSTGALLFWFVGSRPPVPEPGPRAPSHDEAVDVATSAPRDGQAVAPTPLSRETPVPRTESMASPNTWREALELAKESCPLGRLEDRELSSMVGLLANLERGSAERLHGYLSSGGEVGGVEHADLVFDHEGARAKSLALLEGNYLLLGPGEELPAAISHDPSVHLVQGPGFRRNGEPFVTYIVIDLNAQGRFAEAKRVLESRLRERRGARGR